jgi:hypothetical protein
MRAAVNAGRWASRWWAVVTIGAAGALVPSAHIGAQVIRGSLVDAETKTPVGGATISVRGERDSLVTSVQTSDKGQFKAVLNRPGRYSLDVRRVGFAELKTTAAPVEAGDTVTIALEIARLPVALDTVVSVDKSSVFPTTPGREFVRRHYALNEGVQVSGWAIEKSGLSLSEYLGKYVPGIHTTDVIQQFNPASPGRLTPPAIPAEHGRFIMADSGTQCLYARVDRYSLVYMLYNKDVESIDELLSVKNVMAVEVFRSPREVPPEWRSDARVTSLFQRRNTGEYYLIGDTGFPAMNVSAIQDQNSLSIASFKSDSTTAADSSRSVPRAQPGLYDLDSYGLQPVNDIQLMQDNSGGGILSQQTGNLSAPVCAFLQIWTYSAW